MAEAGQDRQAGVGGKSGQSRGQFADEQDWLIRRGPKDQGSHWLDGVLLFGPGPQVLCLLTGQPPLSRIFFPIKIKPI